MSLAMRLSPGIAESHWLSPWRGHAVHVKLHWTSQLVNVSEATAFSAQLHCKSFRRIINLAVHRHTVSNGSLARLVTAWRAHP
jgi:hypothetical protein